MIETPLLAMVVSLNFDRSKFIPGVIDDDELRIGFQVWTPNEDGWEDWETQDKKIKGKPHLGF